jgi:hypothetical protein
MANSTLAAIRTKVRRLTRSPSTSQISDADIDEYVNTFCLYDFPEHLRLSTLRKTLVFYTQPYIDTYSTSLNPADPLYDFKNRVMAVYKPMYVAGNEVFFSQSREELYGIYPLNQTIRLAGSGNGILKHFTGVLADTPCLRNNVVFTSIDANNNGLQLHDDGNGLLIGNGNGIVNYITGVYVLDYTIPPAVGQNIKSQVLYYQPSRPAAMCYFNTSFIFRPVPDQVYQVNVEVDVRPTELITAGTSPELQQWWQWIAYGAAKKIFEDRMDLESVQSIMPEFKKQENLVLRTTIVNQSKQRVSTIYTDQYMSGHQWWPSGTSF